MELIKQIKDAEKEAGTIIESARQEAAVIHEQAVKQAQTLRKGSEARRQQMIDKAVQEAEAEGSQDVETLVQQGKSEISQLQQSCQGGKQRSVQKVLVALKNLS